MIYNDAIYGKVKIEEPVILDLIKSPSLQRLKGIFQLGHRVWYPEASHNFTERSENKINAKLHTRFEHSLGVFILLKKFGASIEEQIAGILHDISHTVFCHTGDYIFDSGCQKSHTFQDNIHKDFVFNTEIPNLLKRYKIDVNFILDDKNFPLKERPLPDLCADRIDYFLRDAFYFKELSRKEIKEILDNFIILKNSWLFKNFKFANKFAKKYRKINNLYWSGLKAALMFGTVSEAIKYGLEKKYLREKDVFTTDKKVLDKLNKFKNEPDPAACGGVSGRVVSQSVGSADDFFTPSSPPPASNSNRGEQSGGVFGRRRNKDKNLELLLKRMNRKIKWKLNKKHYDLHLFTKSRAVDPLVKIQNKIKRVSEIDKNYAKILEKESKPREYFIKFKNYTQ